VAIPGIRATGTNAGDAGSRIPAPSKTAEWRLQ
jgi:hypothetical protein